jgi:flagellar protein FlbD
MIELTRMGGKAVLVNEDWLELVEENPDTTLVFASGTKLLVKQGVAQVLERIEAWRKSHPALKGSPKLRPKARR